MILDDAPKDSVTLITNVCIKYTAGKLVMAQAATLLTTLSQIAFGRTPKIDTLLNYLGYEKTPDEIKEIEIGYNGDIEAWFTAGKRPAGWYMTRPEYMKNKK